MEPSEVREIVLRELPRLVSEDPEVRRKIIELSTRYFADRTQTENRFDRLLDELRRDREEQSRRRDEQIQKWNEQTRRLDDEASRWQDQNRKWDDEGRRWQEQNRKWDENQRAINRMLDSMEALSRKHDSTIGALSARWGLNAESSFRNALKGILEESFGVEVVTVAERDDDGEVFGRPDQVELDLIIKDGVLIVCEIKSSVSKAEVYAFERKVRFYEKRHRRSATRMLIVSPTVDRPGRVVAEKLGIEVYSYAEDVAAPR